MTVQAIRVSKTSFKPWQLFGATQDALCNAVQSDTIKAIPLHLDDVHGQPVDVELWVNTDEASLEFGSNDELNPTAQMILRQANPAPTGGVDDLPEIPIIKGVGVLTGVGGTDFPQENVGCILGALVGHHATSS